MIKNTYRRFIVQTNNSFLNKFRQTCQSATDVSRQWRHNTFTYSHGLAIEEQFSIRYVSIAALKLNFVRIMNTMDEFYELLSSSIYLLSFICIFLFWTNEAKTSSA